MEESILPMNYICFYKCSLADVVYLLNGIFYGANIRKYSVECTFFSFVRGLSMG